LRSLTAGKWQGVWVALAAVGAAAAVRALLYHALGGGLPFLTFFPAVVVAAQYGGLGGGLLAVALSVVVASVWHDPSVALLGHLARLALFVSVSLLCVWLVERVRRAHLRAEAGRVASARLAAIVESSGDAIIGLDCDGTVSSWNESAARSFGYTQEEMIGRPIQRLLPPDRADEETHLLERVGRGERVANFESVRVAKDGRQVPVSLTVSPVMDGAGKVVGVSKIVRDVTERKRAEEEREQLLESERAARVEAERASRMKDEFLATLSHELRTPLNAIVGWSHLLLTGGREAADVNKAAETIERNARMQAQLIEDLLDMSRITSGKLRLQVQRVDLAAVVEAAVETARLAAEARGVGIEASLDRSAPPVAGDPARLQQVVWNLLSNAAKFTPRGGMVRVGLAAAGEATVEITVKDTGQGIDADFLPHVFERFRQADGSTTRSHGGLGIGLAIVKHLVELHGGTVTAQSEGAGKGATFVVRLPAAPARVPAAEVAPAPAGSSDGNGRHASLKGLRVLVVDDEPDALSLVRRLLEDRGAEVTSADSVAQAIEAMAAGPPDVLLSDIGMRGEDGYTLIRRIRAMPPEEGGRVPAVALTAFARPEDRRRAMLAGFHLHLAKPVEAEELCAVVATLAGGGPAGVA